MAESQLPKEIVVINYFVSFCLRIVPKTPLTNLAEL
jgi:hypothetical protein